MTPAQVRYFDLAKTKRELPPEVELALDFLSSKELSLPELADLASALQRAPVREEADMVVRGVIRR